MREKTRLASLIPYLDSSTVRLEIPLRSDDPVELEGISDPFVVVDDSSPLGRLMEARIITDGGVTVSRLSLFVQRSQYRLVPDPLLPFTNLTLASMWQQTYKGYLQQKDSGLVHLAGVSDQQGNITPFAPLFLCKTRKIYFEPPCPYCGEPLRQCEDDELLSSFSLPAFSSTLERFLYCAKCSTDGKQTCFYTYNTEHLENKNLWDRMELVKAFSSLALSPEKDATLPCANCSEKDECFGPREKALSRIAIFSFFPFYVIPLRAMSLHCADFLALLSGARPDDLQNSAPPHHSRAARIQLADQAIASQLPFFFDSDNRLCEILYLKLEFLRQLTQWVDRIPVHKLGPGGSLSLESFWVDLPEQTDLLPYFWNFKIKPHGLVLSFDVPLLSNRDTTLPHHGFLALAWLYVMLTNSKQQMDEILKQLEPLFVDGSPVAVEEFLKHLDSSEISALAPQNLLWAPDEARIPDHFRPLWSSCMQLLWETVTAASDRSPKQPNLDYWVQEIENLQAQVKEALFPLPQPISQMAPKVTEQSLELDTSIGAALAKIAKKWEREMMEAQSFTQQAPDQQAHPTKSHEEQPQPPLEETIIVAPRPTEPTPQEQAAPEAMAEPEEVEEIPETVIFTAPRSPEEAPQFEGTSTPVEQDQPGASTSAQDKEFEKTLSLLDQELMGLVDEAPPAAESEPTGQLDETPVQEGPEKKEESEEVVPETVIIKPEDL